jgi:hypothetical protein
VVQHEVRDGGVECPGVERKRLNITDACIDAARQRQLDHPSRLVDRHDLDPLAEKPLSELAAATANLDHSAGPSPYDVIERDILWLGPGPSSPQRDPPREAGLVGVLTPNSLRIVLFRCDPALMI